MCKISITEEDPICSIKLPRYCDYLPTTENITEYPTGGAVEIWHSYMPESFGWGYKTLKKGRNTSEIRNKRYKNMRNLIKKHEILRSAVVCLRLPNALRISNRFPSFAYIKMMLCNQNTNYEIYENAFCFHTTCTMTRRWKGNEAEVWNVWNFQQRCNDSFVYLFSGIIIFILKIWNFLGAIKWNPWI